MKTKQELLQMLFSRLYELEENSNLSSELRHDLTIELALLYDILGEEVDEDYWNRIEILI